MNELTKHFLLVFWLFDDLKKTYELQLITVHKFNSGLIGEIQSVELFKYEKLITFQLRAKNKHELVTFICTFEFINGFFFCFITCLWFLVMIA